MKVFVWFVLVLCVHSSHQQQNRPNNQINALAYSQSDFNPLPPIQRTTTTTEEPESTTKKKGFFSGFTGLFKSKDKETTTEQPTTTKKAATQTQTTTTTVKPSSVATAPKLPPRSDSVTPPPRPQSPTKQELTSARPPPPPVPARPDSLPPAGPPPAVPQSPNRQQTTTLAPKKKDDFPSLPTPPGSKLPGQQQPTSTAAPKKTTQDEFPALPTVAPSNRPPGLPNSGPPSVPNAWGKPPGAVIGPTPKPQSFFSQLPTTTTKKPQFAVPPRVDTTASVSSGPTTDAELLTLSESLFSKDIHNAFKYVTVNYQGRTQSSATTDEAAQPLLKIDDKLTTVNTVEKMKALYNNYEQDAAINEYVSPNERKEEDEFLDSVLATPVMRHAMNFLAQKGLVTTDPQTHRELLKTIWFNLYSRGMGKIGSSGFEHVFLSEVKNGTVMGLHNWIYMSEAEKAGDLDYKGWTKKIDLGNKGQIAKVRFTLNNLVKPSNSLFIGTSPELELALYTVCFELRADKECRLAYGGKDFNIVTHSYRYRGKNLIGSAYPEI